MKSGYMEFINVDGIRKPMKFHNAVKIETGKTAPTLVGAFGGMHID